MKLSIHSSLTELSGFIAYYRNKHAHTTRAGRTIQGNAARFIAQQLNTIIAEAKLSDELLNEIKQYRSERKRKQKKNNSPEADPAMSSILSALTPEQKRALLQVLIDPK
jgi:hypothetical protein